MKRPRAFETLALAAIVALAAFFRLYRLDQLPPGFQFDQAFNAFDILRLLQGQFAIFFPANTGREPLYFYLSMVSAALFGQTAFAVKLTSAIIGIVTIPLIYQCTRSIFSPTSALLEKGRAQSQNDISKNSSSPHALQGRAKDKSFDALALLAALFSAVSLWHIFFSRDGLRVILQVPLTLLTFFFLWRALFSASHANQGEKSWGTWFKVGLFLALALYTYPSARLLPLALIFLTGYGAWYDRTRAVEYFKNLVLSFLLAALFLAPLGIYFALYPDQFIAHTGSISVFDPRVNEGNIPAVIWKNFVSILSSFFIQGDGGLIRNVPFRPIFDPFIGGLFLSGVGVLQVALFHPRSTRSNRNLAVFLSTWMVISLASSLFSDDAPNFLRMLPAFPPLMILPAWGAVEIWNRLKTQLLRRIAIFGLSIVILFSAGWTYRDYFVTFADSPTTYYAFGTDKVEFADWVNQNARHLLIFSAPLFQQDGTIMLMTRNAPLKSFESRDTIVLPANTLGRDVVFAFPGEQEKKIQTMAMRFGDLGAREDLTGSNGGKLAWLYRIPAKNLPAEANPLAALARGGDFIQPNILTHATWDDSFELLGYSIDASDTPKRNLEVTLFLHALKSMTEDYTFSVKVRDAKDRTWGQEDKWTGDNSYATSQWSPGDIIIEKFYPGLNACAPVGDYHVTVEAYNLKTSQTFGSVVNLGMWQAAVPQSNRLEDLEIDHALDVAVGQAHLLGYTLTPEEISAGSPFSFSLFWRGIGDGKQSSRAVIKLRDAAKRDFVLADMNILLPSDGRGLCTFSDFTVPQDVAPGAGSIFVNDVKIGTINVTR